MHSNYHGNHLEALKKQYFSDPKRRISLAKGETLLTQGKHNDRLYLMLEGTAAAYVNKHGGGRYELFQSGKEMFIGVYSFFSKSFVSSATVITQEPCLVAYIDQYQIAVDNGKSESLFEQFMPIVVENLLHRMQKEQAVVFEKEQALKKLIQTEKLAGLGQMAAGIAHELNNAISVVERNTSWLKTYMKELIAEHHQDEMPFFQLGLEQGRELSTREIRKHAKDLMESLDISREEAKKLAETGINPKLIEVYGASFDEAIPRIHHYWEMGTSLHDMSIAARMTAHVVRSVKALAVKRSVKEVDLDVNDTIREAFILLTSPLRHVQLNTDLTDVPLIFANRGELVQVWTNLIRNAIEALMHHNFSAPVIKIRTLYERGNVIVQIIDNGPGIPKDILPKILQPNFTTKERGLDFGLGLGLPIVARIIDHHNGDLSVQSQPGVTVFNVSIPAQEGGLF
ncbi:cyclic nucleotide-binding domain-containing protein [bacterium]|nr:cyclic nucleotide-binding domain-containing protein [bacterium]